MSEVTTATIESRLVDILSQIKSRDVAAEIAENDDFVRALNLDSLDAVELTVRLGGDFGVEFGAEAEDLDALESFRALVALVQRRATL